MNNVIPECIAAYDASTTSSLQEGIERLYNDSLAAVVIRFSENDPLDQVELITKRTENVAAANMAVLGEAIKPHDLVRFKGGIASWHIDGESEIEIPPRLTVHTTVKGEVFGSFTHTQSYRNLPYPLHHGTSLMWG